MQLAIAIQTENFITWLSGRQTSFVEPRLDNELVDRIGIYDMLQAGCIKFSGASIHNNIRKVQLRFHRRKPYVA